MSRLAIYITYVAKPGQTIVITFINLNPPYFREITWRHYVVILVYCAEPPKSDEPSRFDRLSVSTMCRIDKVLLAV